MIFFTAVLLPVPLLAAFQLHGELSHTSVHFQLCSENKITKRVSGAGGMGDVALWQCHSFDEPLMTIKIKVLLGDHYTLQ